MILKTKRLTISPMTMEELNDKVESMTDEALQQAYSEMRQGCIDDPENFVWYAPWKICLKEDGTEIGDACFKGSAKKGAVEIGYGLEEPYRDQGYMTEAVEAMVQWAFSQPGVYAVDAETEPGNEPSKRLLLKLQFKPNGKGEEGPRFRKMKPLHEVAVLYMLLGMSVGMSIGYTGGKMSIGLSIGMVLGYAVGMLLDVNEKRRRNQALYG